jgi:SNF2-related domain
MIPRQYQVEMAEVAVYLLRSYNIAYFAAEERTGKTLASLVVAKSMPEITNVVVITKKEPLAGWNNTAAAYDIGKPLVITNYHQIKNLAKCTPGTLLIIDEAHAYIAGYPKTSGMWKQLKNIATRVKILFMSATPKAQGTQQLYHQLAISSYSPWHKYDSFYKWFKSYGEVYTIKLQGRECNQYDKIDHDKVWDSVKHLFITKTRAELGFEHEPTDKLHYVELDQVTKDVYNELLEDKIVHFHAGTLVCDTNSRLRPALHMIEGGVTKINDEALLLKNREKIDYILKHFGDNTNTVIMYNYIAEGVKLRQVFQHCPILQATSYAEGVDLSMYKDLVIYSMNFSTAKYVQRRARQANMERKEEITVHYLLVKKAISDQVYKTVAINKRNFVDSLFERTKL